MTARILTHPRFNRGSAIRAVHPVDEATRTLDQIGQSIGVDPRTASGADLDRLTDAVWESLAARNFGRPVQ